MTSKTDTSVAAQDPEEKEGLFGGFKSLRKLLYVQPSEEQEAASQKAGRKPDVPSGSRPTIPPSLAQAHAVGANLDPELTDEMRKKLLDAVDDAGPAFKQFLMSLRSLEKTVPDPTMRIQAVLSMLAVQSVTPVEIKLDLAKVRGQLQTTMSEDERGYTHAVSGLATERSNIESTFRTEQEQLQARLTQLTAEMAQIQSRLGAIPQEQQEATADVASRTEVINRNHQHVQAAHAAVVTELDALASHLQ